MLPKRQPLTEKKIKKGIACYSRLATDLEGYEEKGNFEF